MAGGMGRRGGGRTLAERSAAVGAGTAAAAPGAATSPPTARHCWILDSDARTPGLVIEWRHRSPAAEWEGRVVYVDHHHGREALIEAWLPASALQPAAGS